MVGFTQLLLLATLLNVQESETERSISDEIAELIEKTNALSSFHASYQFEIRESVDETQFGSIEFAYEAPDRGRIKFSSPEGVMDLWSFGSRMTMHYPGEDGKESWKTAAIPASAFEPLEPSEAERVLDERFPPSAPSESELEPGVSFVLQWPGMEDSKREGLNANVMYKNRRARLLDWFGYLQDHTSAIQVNGEQLVLGVEDSLCWISRESGFIERLEIPETPESKSMVLTLEALRLDEPVAELFKLPPEAATAEEMESSRWERFRSLQECAKPHSRGSRLA